MATRSSNMSRTGGGGLPIKTTNQGGFTLGRPGSRNFRTNVASGTTVFRGRGGGGGGG